MASLARGGCSPPCAQKAGRGREHASHRLPAAPSETHPCVCEADGRTDGRTEEEGAEAQWETRLKSRKVGGRTGPDQVSRCFSQSCSPPGKQAGRRDIATRRPLCARPTVLRSLRALMVQQPRGGRLSHPLRHQKVGCENGGTLPSCCAASQIVRRKEPPSCCLALAFALHPPWHRSARSQQAARPRPWPRRTRPGDLEGSQSSCPAEPLSCPFEPRLARGKQCPRWKE